MKFKIIKRFGYRWAGFLPAAATLGAAVFAVTANGAGSATLPTNIIQNSNDIVNIFCAALNWMFWLFIVLSIAMALVSAYLYTTSNGDAEQVGKATKTLTYVAIAIVVALLAKGVPLIIGTLFGINSGLNVCSGGGAGNGANGPIIQT